MKPMRFLAVSFFIVPALFAQKLTASTDAKSKVDQVFARYASQASPGCAVGTSIGRDVSFQAAYNLAAMLVGRVSGKSIAEFTKENIFQPLDMSSTSWRDDYRRIVPNRAMAYSNAGGVLRTDMPFEDAHGNGGLLTTVGDLLRWN